ncbi:hypothetical protein IGI04_016863 [Brassica rapa subsp. trilocularis]|uniref:Amino acid transporter transmembrane domain-containing protein n=1 Tax=Brassica rapa subsp. trilocularis TaxID=1813537 RepID=A0ABQ7MU74_BRACM|nr:hypothetical protein IGI04_016863 [Brassica rapa subsp. trilocularis]
MNPEAFFWWAIKGPCLPHVLAGPTKRWTGFSPTHPVPREEILRPTYVIFDAEDFSIPDPLLLKKNIVTAIKEEGYRVLIELHLRSDGYSRLFTGDFVWLNESATLWSQANNNNLGNSLLTKKLAFSKLLHVAEEGGGEEERQRLLAAETQEEPFVVTTMNATEAMNCKVNVRGDDVDIEIPDTAHQISSDSWFQVAFVLTTGINSAYVLGYSGTVMVPLGWVGGMVGLLLATVISLYANTLVAKLHEFGGKRHIRYRDLAGFIYGRKAYHLTWGLQYVNLFMINCGFIILAGSALKAVYVLFRDDHTIKLPHCIAIAGLICAVFAIGIPHLSALGVWLAVSTILSLIYIVVAIVLSVRDGAAANLVFAFNTGMLPEIQATVRQPVVKNMMKALYFQFTAGVLPMYAVTFIGYWAYGSSTSTYLLNSVNGPLWVKALANISAILQSVISLHIFASPTYEYMDTRFGIKGHPLALKNLVFRIMARGGYIAVSTLISALLPFLGDFMSLTGAVSTFPLTFILANHMYYKAKNNKLSPLQKLWHWLNVGFFSLMSVAAAIAALRLIALDSRNFHVFADL